MNFMCLANPKLSFCTKQNTICAKYRAKSVRCSVRASAHGADCTDLCLLVLAVLTGKVWKGEWSAVGKASYGPSAHRGGAEPLMALPAGGALG
jgi:hypothetical protein